VRPDSSSDQRLVLLVVAGTALILGVIAFGLLHSDTLGSIDSSIKFLQASSFAASGFRSMALAYPASALDPRGLFLPYDPPFAFLNAGGYQGIFPSAYALIAASLVRFGPGALKLLSIAGAAMTAGATFRLAERAPRWLPAMLLVFATPVWFYGTEVSEVPLALAACTAAFVVARRETPGVDLFCGLLLGVAAVLRDESLLVVPGLLYARYRYARPTFRVVPLVVGIAIPIGLFAIVDDLWLRRPVLAHLRHAVPLLNKILPRSRAMLPQLPVLSWPDRYSTIVHYWLLGDGPFYVIAGVVAVLAIAIALRRGISGAVIVAIVAIGAVILQWHDVAPLLLQPRFLTGLLRLSPFLIFAVLPFAPGSAPGPARAVALATAATFLAGTWITLSIDGGKELGPRLLIVLWPLLVATAWDGFRSWWDWSGPRVIRATVVGAGAILMVGSVVMELGVALPAWTGRVRSDAETLDAVRGTRGQVVVLTDDIDMQLVGADFLRRPVMYVARGDLWGDFSARMVAAGKREFLVVTRVQRPPQSIPPFRLADDREVGRYRLLRFVR
jgi:hypothetical protein